MKQLYTVGNLLDLDLETAFKKAARHLYDCGNHHCPEDLYISQEFHLDELEWTIKLMGIEGTLAVESRYGITLNINNANVLLDSLHPEVLENIKRIREIKIREKYNFSPDEPLTYDMQSESTDGILENSTISINEHNFLRKHLSDEQLKLLDIIKTNSYEFKINPFQSNEEVITFELIEGGMECLDLFATNNLQSEVLEEFYLAYLTKSTDIIDENEDFIIDSTYEELKVLIEPISKILKDAADSFIKEQVNKLEQLETDYYSFEYTLDDIANNPDFYEDILFDIDGNFVCKDDFIPYEYVTYESELSTTA